MGQSGIPAKHETLKQCWFNAGRWPGVKSTLFQCLGFAWMVRHWFTACHWLSGRALKPTLWYVSNMHGDLFRFGLWLTTGILTLQGAGWPSSYNQKVVSDTLQSAKFFTKVRFFSVSNAVSYFSNFFRFQCFFIIQRLSVYYHDYSYYKHYLFYVYCISFQKI